MSHIANRVERNKEDLWASIKRIAAPIEAALCITHANDKVLKIINISRSGSVALGVASLEFFVAYF